MKDWSHTNFLTTNFLCKAIFLSSLSIFACFWFLCIPCFFFSCTKVPERVYVPTRWIPFEELTIDVFSFVPLPSIYLSPPSLFKHLSLCPSLSRSYLPSSLYPSLNSPCFLWRFSPPLFLHPCLILSVPPSTPSPLSSTIITSSCLLPDHIWFILFFQSVLNELNRAKWHPSPGLASLFSTQSMLISAIFLLFPNCLCAWLLKNVQQNCMWPNPMNPISLNLTSDLFYMTGSFVQNVLLILELIINRNFKYWPPLLCNIPV